MSLELVRVAFINEQDASFVGGVVMRVFDKSNSNLLLHLESGADGHINFDLEGSPEGVEYHLRLYKAGARAEPKRILIYSPVSFAPTSTNHFLVPIQFFSLPAAINPFMCRASGYLLGPARMPRRNVSLTFLPKFNAFVDESAVSLPGRFTTNSDDEGFVSIELYRFGMYEVTIEGREPVTRNIEVPDRPAVVLPHLLFPIVVWVSYAEPPPHTVQVGTTLFLSPLVLTTDYRKLGAGVNDVLYSSSDPSLANVQVIGDRIAIRGLKPGTIQLCVERRDRSIVYLPHFGIQGGELPITITA